MFADPAVVTVNAVAKNLVRVNQDKYSSEYRLRTPTEQFLLNIRNSPPATRTNGTVVERHNIELVHTVFPVLPSVVSTVRKAYIVFENQQGDTLTDPKYIVSALTAFLSAANIDKMLGGES